MAVRGRAAPPMRNLPGEDSLDLQAGASESDQVGVWWSKAIPAIEPVATRNTFPPGAELVQQGEAASGVYFITLGLVKIEASESDGRCTTVGLRRLGWPLGAGAVILGRPHPVTAIAVTRAVVLHVSNGGFRSLLRSRPEVSYYVHAVHCLELHEQIERASALACGNARGRLKQTLTHLASAAGRHEGSGAFELRLPIRHWELARLIGVTPPYLSSLLTELERDGAIRRQGDVLVLPSTF